jgi:site-specific DNA recombinase
MKAIIFTRVSTKEQADEGYSLEAQEKLLREYSGKQNFKIIKVYKIAETASKEMVRKSFKEVFEYTNKNKVDIIVCEKIDRLTRNLKDAAIADDWVKQDPAREIHFVKESFILNANTRAHENLVWDMKVAIARFYSNNLSEEVKKGHKEKVAQGWYPSKAPLAYTSIGEKGHKTHILDSVKAPLIRKMFEYYSTGRYSLMALVETMYNEGLRTHGGNRLVKSRMSSLLSDPYYYGEIRWNGKIYPGKHEPLITKQLHDKVQDVLHGRTTPRHNKHIFIFKGHVRCQACGKLVTWETKKGHVYGHCNKYNNCPVKMWYKEPEIIDQLLPAFSNLKITNSRLLEWVRKGLKESHQQISEYSTSALSELNKQMALIQNRLDRLYDDKLDQKITEDMYKRKFEQYSQEKQSIVQAIGKHSKANDKYQELGSLLFDVSQKADDLFVKADTLQKRKIINYALTNFKIKDGLLSYEYTKPFQLLNAAVKVTNSFALTKPTIELDKLPINKERTRLLDKFVLYGSGAGIRTQDRSINSRLLYR